MLRFRLIIFLFLLSSTGWASKLFIPMDANQANHLKAYGIAFWILENQSEVDWLLNYRGGSFSFDHAIKFENELIIRGISYQVISDANYNAIVSEIASPSSNMDIMKLEKFQNCCLFTKK